jgi:tRNA (guanine-N7-)-methyltransferase
VTTRTYHPRQGRLTTRHRATLADRWSAYAVPDAGPLSAERLFGDGRPLVVEIGSGMGEATAAMAAADPERGFLAVEIHRPGLANLLRLADEAELANLRIAEGDALELLRDRVAADSLDALHMFFPDPWPKKRHHKRRLIVPARVALLRSRLRPGGVLHAATDDAEYAAAMLETLSADPGLMNTAPDGFAAHRGARPRTKFEQRGVDAGRDIYELVFRRTDGRDGSH